MRELTGLVLVVAFLIYAVITASAGEDRSPATTLPGYYNHPEEVRE